MGRAARKAEAVGAVRQPSLGLESHIVGFSLDEEIRNWPSGEEIRTHIVYLDPGGDQFLQSEAFIAFEYEVEGEEEGDRDERPWIRNEMQSKLLSKIKEALPSDESGVRVEHVFHFEHGGDEYLHREDTSQRVSTFRVSAKMNLTGETREVKDPLRTLDEINTPQSRALFRKMILDCPSEEWIDRALLAHKDRAAHRLNNVVIYLGETDSDDPRIKGLLGDMSQLRDDLTGSPEDEDLQELCDRLEVAQRNIDWASSILGRILKKMSPPEGDLEEILVHLQQTGKDLRDICAKANRVL